MLKHSKIILGTVQFGLDYGINNSNGKPAASVVKTILDTAFSENIQILDTAEAYGNAHEVIGEYHKSSQNKFKIITKFSSSEVGLPTGLVQRVKHHLETLNVSSLHCYMFHSFGDFETYYESFKEDIKQLKTEGLVEKFGVSIYENNEIESLLEYDELDVIQLPFNLLDNAQQRSRVLQKAKNKGKEIHTRSVYLQGLFFRDENDLPIKLQALKKELNEIKGIASSNNIGLSDLALAYVSQQDYIDKILIGVETVEQLKLNLNALRTSLPIEILNRIGELNVNDKLLLNPSNWN